MKQRPVEVAGRLDGLVMPEKYTSVSCGVATRANGNLLLVDSELLYDRG